jgi:hypothetical protein
VRRWDGKDLYVLDCKLFAAAEGKWLKRSPYARDFQKFFTVYTDPDFDFQTALRDFVHAHGVERIGYNPDDITLPVPESPCTSTGTRVLMPVPVDDVRLARSHMVWPRDRNGAKEALAYFLRSTERTAPVLAVLYAIASLDQTAVDIEYEKQEQARRDQRNAAVAAEIAECKQLPGATVLIELSASRNRHVEGYEDKLWVTKDEAILMIGRYDAHLARREQANAK